MLRRNKTEWKRQKDVLKRYMRYLPMLHLKQQQLQISIRRVQAKQEKLKKEYDVFISALSEWIAVFSDDVHIPDIMQLKEVQTDTGNVAGVAIPIYKGCEFINQTYSIFDTPFWFDKGISKTQEVVEMKAHIDVLDTQIVLLSDELRRTTQRINLFEKVLIPETRNNIRVIQIALGDQQTAAVVRGKICKRKIQESAK